MWVRIIHGSTGTQQKMVSINFSVLTLFLFYKWWSRQKYHQVIERNKSDHAYTTGLQTVNAKGVNCDYKYFSMFSIKELQSPLKTLLSTFLYMCIIQPTKTLIPENLSKLFPNQEYIPPFLLPVKTQWEVYFSIQELLNAYLPTSGYVSDYYVLLHTITSQPTHWILLLMVIKNLL